MGQSITQLDVGEADELSLARERLMGESVAKYLYQDPDFIDDPIIGDAVQTIWDRLLGSARAQGLLSPAMDQAYAWRILLGKDKSFNAFAVPGGFIGLHLGLIAATNSPDELAAVLAHELSHVTQRHISRGMAHANRAAPALMVAMLLGIAAAKKSDALAQAAVIGSSALSTQLQLNYTREMEREADRTAFPVVAGAGYAPAGFLSMFEKMFRVNRLNDDGSFPYLRTHPLTVERIASAHNRLQQEAPSTSALRPLSTLAYQLIAARARAKSNLSLDALRPLAIETEQAGFSQYTLDRRVVALVVGSQYFQSTGQSDKAVQLLAQLQPLTASDPEARTIARQLQVDLALAQRNWHLANQLLGDRPTTRADALLKAQALLGVGETLQALELLQLRVAQFPQDALAWQLLAQAHEKQGHTLRHVRALAEAQLAQYDLQGAYDRLRSAKQLAPIGRLSAEQEVDLSIINSRLMALEQILLNAK